MDRKHFIQQFNCNMMDTITQVCEKTMSKQKQTVWKVLHFLSVSKHLHYYKEKNI